MTSGGRTLVFGLISVYLFGMTSLPVPLSVILILVFWLATGGSRLCYLAMNTIPRDLRLLSRGIYIVFAIIYVKTFDMNVVKLFRQTLKKYPNRIMYVNASTGKEWTYSQASHDSIGSAQTHIYHLRIYDVSLLSP